jgi:hypothetical protein
MEPPVRLARELRRLPREQVEKAVRTGAECRGNAEVFKLGIGGLSISRPGHSQLQRRQVAKGLRHCAGQWHRLSGVGRHPEGRLLAHAEVIGRGADRAQILVAVDVLRPILEGMSISVRPG